MLRRPEMSSSQPGRTSYTGSARSRSLERQRPARPRARRRDSWWRCAAHRHAAEDVELVDHQVADAVDRHRVAQRHRVEPAAAALPSGGGAELVALLQQVAAGLVVELGREGPGADARRVGLDDAEHVVDLERADAAAGAGAAGDGVARGDEGVGAVVEVEQRALGALEDDVLALRRARPGRGWWCPRCAAAAARPRPTASLEQLVEVEAGQAVGLVQDGVALGQHARQPGSQRRGVEQVPMRTPARQARSA